ncbi:MAG: hypothetical protein [Bacteriophage sp.]|nr:MAG: hypothetical protein [Bacteriophage sp.]
MEELFKRIEVDVYKMGDKGAIHLAPILNDMLLHSYPLILQDFILDQTGKTLDIDEFTEITGFSGDMMKYIIENHLAVNVFIQGENLIIKATAFSIEDDMFYIEYNHAGDKKALQITLSGDTFQILVKDIDSGGGNYLTKDDIINSLDSLDAQKVLAASQGYVLNESIFPYFDINGSNWHGLLLEDINNTTPIEEINEVYASKFEEMGKLMLREHILVICASRNNNYSVMMASYSSENYQGNTRYHLDFNSLRGDSIAINLIVSENMDEVIQVLNT